MSVVYAIRWRLLYLDGRQLDELPQGATILEAWPNPVELHLMDITGQSVMRVVIPAHHRPIFYRRRSIGVNLVTGERSETRLDATIFGYGREVGERGNTKLWLWSKGRAVGCPQEYIDQTAIERLLTG